MIDLLRGFAAISVVVYHVISHFNWTAFPVTGPLTWFRIGGFGVDLFFVISGFVIAQSVFSRSQDVRFREFAVGFARARAARIIPLHYLTCLVFVVFIQPSLVLVPDIWKQILSHATFAHSWLLMHSGGINGVNWSVAVEMQFYFVMLFAARWVARANPLVVGIGALAIAWIWRLGVFLFFSLHPSDGSLGVFPIFVYTTELPGMLDEFVAGILLARFLRSSTGNRVLEWLRRRPWPALGITAFALVITFRIYWSDTTYWDSASMVVLFKSLLALAWMLVLLTACVLQYPLLVQLTAPLRYLGTISYGIYLWHLPVILALKRVAWLNAPHALPWVLGLTFVFAAGSWHFFEKPIMMRYGPPRRSTMPSSSSILASKRTIGTRGEALPSLALNK